MHRLSVEALNAYDMELKALEPHPSVYVCGSFPGAVLAGLGLRPVRLPVSAVSTETPPVRDDVCPLIPLLFSSLDEWEPAVIAGMYTCDMTRRFFQETFRITGRPVHQIQLPAVSGRTPQDFFSEQIERMCRDLVRSGLSPGYHREMARDWYMSCREGMEYLRENMHTMPPVALQCFFHLFRICDPSRAISIIRSLHERHSDYRGKFILLRSGSPAVPGDIQVENAVEDSGGLLLPVNCTGTEMFPGSVPDDWSPAGLAGEHFRNRKCVRCRPNEVTFRHLRDSAGSLGAQGIIVRCLTFCDLWYTEKVRLKEKLDVPVLVLDSGMHPGEGERTAMRIETFIETLGVL